MRTPAGSVILWVTPAGTTLPRSMLGVSQSFWSTLQRELLDQTSWQTPEQLGSAIFEWIEAWYNPRRRHTSLEMLSPVQFEHHWETQTLHTAAEGAA